MDDIPSDYFTENKSIYGRVEKVIDGDTIRVRHCPTFFTCPDPETGKKLSDSTLSIRMYGVDSPELQKKKSDPPSQPFAKEAKDFTSDLIMQKTVEIKLLKKDQYSRAIAKVQSGTQDISLELLQRGYATMYKGKGAEYDGNRKVFELAQEVAKQKKVGIWSLEEALVTPAEFKREQRQLQLQ